MAKKLRAIDAAVISDVHLGTYASKAAELLQYLKSIQPRTLILNGDIFDAWRFTRNYFPRNHLKVVRQLVKMMEKGVKVVYITGNHDEVLRKFENVKLGNFSIANQHVLELSGQKTLIFHGDIFDAIIHRAKWLAKMGAAAYGFISIINQVVNHLRKIINREPVVLYKKLKKRFDISAVNMAEFEAKVAHAARLHECQTVICGHTHIAVDKILVAGKSPIRYINCGDWVESFSSAEFYDGNWSLYHFIFNPAATDNSHDETFIPDHRQVHQTLLEQLLVFQA